MYRIKSETLSEKANSKPIIFPEFQVAAGHTTDNIWVDNLLSAARGEFFNRVSYDGNNLILKDIGVKERLPKQDPAKLVAIFIRFHSDHLGRVSDVQVQEQNRRRREIFERKVVLSWSNCNKHTKRYLIILFAEQLNASLGRDERSLKQLTNTLLQGLNCKIFGPHNVEFYNNQIQSIVPLQLNEENGWWWLDATPENKSPASKAVKRNKDCVVYHSWNNVVDYYIPPTKKTTARPRKRAAAGT